MTLRAGWRGQRLIILLAAVVAAAATARLGVWQMSRAAQKTALHEAVVARSTMPPLPQASLVPAGGDGASQWHRQTLLRGRWLPKYTVYLDNRQMNGRPGFYVVTPLELSPGDAMLVQRGWIPVNPSERTRVPDLPTPDGVVEVAGRIAPPPSRLYELAQESAGRIRQNLDLAAFERETGLRLRPMSVLMADWPGTPADGLLRQWPVPTADVAKHHGYAFQWFSLSALIVGLYVWFQILRPRHDRPA